MTHVPGDLQDAFSDDAALLHSLRARNAHVHKLVEQYHALNRAVHRIESDVAPASDEHLEGLKKQRLALLDALAEQLALAKAA
ncbi:MULTISPECIES: DUF465 domain-containing protein [unclassified Sphingomonas]|uniref:YdcH family protein n=1 Tax=Novosphingobium rhizosphaerae TaxID=1551649 RepID=UPI0015CDB072